MMVSMAITAQQWGRESMPVRIQTTFAAASGNRRDGDVCFKVSVDDDVVAKAW